MSLLTVLDCQHLVSRYIDLKQMPVGDLGRCMSGAEDKSSGISLNVMNSTARIQNV